MNKCTTYHQRDCRFRHASSPCCRRYAALVVTMVGVGLVLLFGRPAHGQAYFPANHLGRAAAITPAQAWTYYQAEGVASPAASSAPRDSRIKELARALRYDIDLIYQFVRNGIEYEPLFGLKKGAYGAIVHRAGTAFDQAHLMVELLRESDDIKGTGYNPKYVYGTISISKAELESWLGISNLTAEAARKIFADGGVPVSISGGGATISSTEIAHVWVKATINGATYAFDPAFAQHTITEGAIHDGSLNLATVMGYSSSNFLASATSGSAVTSYSINHVSDPNIVAKLSTYAINIANRLRQDEYFASSVDDVIGGKEINRDFSVVRNTANPNVGATYATWSGDIPYSFRTAVTILLENSNLSSNISTSFYSEELAGRRVAIAHDVVAGLYQFSNKPNQPGSVDLRIDGATVASAGADSDDIVNNPWVNVTLSVDHPYAAASGTYMDTAGEHRANLHGFTALVISVGKTSKSYGNEVGRFIPANDKVRRFYHDVNGDGHINGCSINTNPCVFDAIANSAGYLTKLTMAANWLAQATRAMEIHARMKAGIVQQHHALGVLSSAFQMWSNNAVKSESQYFDIETGWSFNNRGNSASARNAFFYALGNTLSSLEASVSQQQLETPDPLSTNATLRWISQSVAPGGHLAGQGHLIYLATPSNWSSVEPMLWSKGFTSGQTNLIESYITQGFSVLLPSTREIGPSELTWRTSADSHETGTARIIFDGANHERIGHLLGRSRTGVLKGGGGAPSLDRDQFPGPDGEFLEDQFKSFAGSFDVDLKSGELLLTPPPDLVVRDGEFPYALPYQRVYSTTIHGRDGTLGLGWRHTYDIRLHITSDSGVFLGEETAAHAAATLAAFVVLHDLMDSSITVDRVLANSVVADWWGRQGFNNSVTVYRGNDSVRFARLPNGSYMPPTGSAASLVQSGQPQLVRREYPNQFGPLDNSAPYTRIQKGYKYYNVTFTYTLEDRSGIDFAFQESPDIAAPRDPLSDSGLFPMDLGKNIRQFRPRTWTFPFGVTITFEYEHGTWGAMTAVRNNLGRRLILSNSGGGPGVSDETGRSVSFSFHPLDDLNDALFHSQNHFMLKSVTDVLENTVTYDIVEFPHIDRTVVWSGNPIRPLLKRVYLPSGNPADSATAFLSIDYDGFGRVEAISDALGQTSQYFVAEGVRGEAVDPVNLQGAGHGLVEHYNEFGRKIRSVDALGNATVFKYDGIGRLVELIKPEGDAERYVYDNPTHNRIRTIRDSGTDASITTETDFHPTFVRKAIAVRDGNCMTQAAAVRDLCQTEHVYNGTTGLRTLSRLPQVEDENGVASRPTMSYEYNGFGRLERTTDPLGVVTDLAYDSTDHTLQSLSVDPGGLNLTTQFDFDTRGNLFSVIDPRGNETTAVYDLKRRITELDQPLGAHTEWVYDVDGLVRKIKQATGDATVPLAVTDFDYFVTGRVSNITDPEGRVTQFMYDEANRRQVTTDPVGRRTRLAYDPAGRVVKEIRAFQWDGEGALPPPNCTYLDTVQQCYATYTYDGNGRRTSVIDANGNRTEFEYDGFDRLSKIVFPDPSGPGEVNPLDFEKFTYDASHNVIDKRTRAGDHIAKEYDNLGRIISKQPGTDPKVLYTYDLASGPKSVRFADGSYTISYDVYDAAGRLRSVTDDGQTIGYGYDDAGNRTRVTWPDGFDIYYSYDALDRVDTVRENSVAGPVLANYDYNLQSRRTLITLGNGLTTEYDYYPDSTLKTLEHDLADSSNDVLYSFSYNGANQMTSAEASNSAYEYQPLAMTASEYDPDGLNRYVTITADGSPVAITYDANQNLTGDGVWTYGYDMENRLISASGPGITATYEYDPLGRRSRKSGSGLATEIYLSDGIEGIADYNGSAVLQRRYVRGPGVDEPLVMYIGTGTANKQYYHADWHGSVMAMSDTSGQLADRYTYSAYGEVDNLTGNPIRYTGRRLDAETGLYYYRARYYSPTLGRFLQTDPIGYGDQLNLYSYVKNDPLNNLDPSGSEIVPVPVNGGTTEDFDTAIEYLMGSPIFSRIYGRVQSSKQIYEVVIDPSAKLSAGHIPHEFDPKTRTITFNPTIGNKLADGSIQSPALGLGHEVAHAARYDVDPEGMLFDLLETREVLSVESTQISDDLEEISVRYSIPIEEQRALSVESEIAREIGEPIRSKQSEGVDVEVESPTFTCSSSSRTC